MKFKWLESVLGTGSAHLCVVDDRNQIASICGTPFLTASRGADPNDSKQCEDCKRIWMSGDEIAFADQSGKKVVVREKCDPIMTGTTDAFEDIVEQLKKTGACYMLIVAMQGERRIHQWSNMIAFGHGAINTFEATAVELILDSRVKREQLEQRNGGD